MKVTFKELWIKNFKGIKDKHFIFNGLKVSVFGANGTGKTSVFDSVCWLLWGKNSQGVEKFDIRPLDENGKSIDFVDIEVCAILSIDGEEVELKKVQRQNWVKQRGQETAVFKGNENTFFINGYPKGDREYKAYISEIVSEDVFKMLTSPTFFPNLKWKEQREILMKFATVETDYELAERLGGYDDILSELKKASTDDIQKKYKLSKKELTDKQAELPVRIDELERQKVNVDVADLEKRKAEIKAEIGATMGDAETLDRLKTERFELEFKINEYVRKANESTIKAKNDAERKASDKSYELKVKVDRWNDLNREVRDIEERIERNIKTSIGLGEEYKIENAKKFDESVWVFDENLTVCKMCGQKLQVEKINTLVSEFDLRKANAKADFESKKKETLSRLLAKGAELKDLISADKEKAESKHKEMSATHEDIKRLSAESDELDAMAKSIPDRVDLSVDIEYGAMIGTRERLDTEIRLMGDAIAKNNADNLGRNSEIAEIDAQISQAKNNENIESRIAELVAEQRNVAQKVADCERILYLVENFVKAKLDNISDAINSKFSMVKFKLFDTQINGGLVECCECTVNGVPYSSVNSAGKIQAGLDIISTLSEIYGVTAPIFVDNRESCTYIPDMKAQTISLYVDDAYKSLQVESE